MNQSSMTIKALYQTADDQNAVGALSWLCITAVDSLHLCVITSGSRLAESRSHEGIQDVSSMVDDQRKMPLARDKVRSAVRQLFG